MTESSELMESFSAIKKKVGKNIYLFKMEEVIAASTRKHEIDTYLKEQNVWDVIRDLSDDDFMLVYGMVINPSCIPYELSGHLKNCFVWVLRDPWTIDTFGTYNFNDETVEEFGSILEATDYIEDCFERGEADDISEFLIIIGYKLDFVIKVASHNYGILDIKQLESSNVQN